jgi:hypothetical protein
LATVAQQRHDAIRVGASVDWPRATRTRSAGDGTNRSLERILAKQCTKMLDLRRDPRALRRNLGELRVKHPQRVFQSFEFLGCAGLKAIAQVAAIGHH